MSYLKVIIVTIAVICVFGLIFLSRSYTRLENTFPQKTNAIISMKNADLNGCINGRKVWSLKANNIEVSQDNSATTLTDISNGIIYDSDKPVIRFEADKVVLNNQTTNFEVFNRLDAYSDSGYNFRCSNAYWSSNKNTLTSLSPVNFSSKQMHIIANRMQINTRLKEMKLWNTKLLIKL